MTVSTPSPNELFNFTLTEQELTTQLQALIQTEISAQGGVIPFSRYMELALYTPGLGYYSNPLAKFGALGDFVTAPLVSNLFGVLLSQQLSELFSFGVAGNLLEFGAGNGQLAADILATVGDAIEHYYILELSADLKERQRELLQQQVPAQLSKVIWLAGMPLDFNGVILANEVLDAQPCNLVHFEAGNLRGVGVGLGTGGFCYQEYSLDKESARVAAELQLPYSDYLSEINLASRAFMQLLGEHLVTGAVLLIDYGVGEHEYYLPEKNRGSLRGFYRQHVLDQVLCYPGLIDITASVEWTSIASSGIAAGLELIGYTTQANFLLNCGLSEQMARLKQQLTNASYLKASNQVNRLIAPSEMGERFKVMGFSKGLQQDSWLGFAAGDKSYTL